MIGSGRPSLPKLANKRRARAKRFSLELNSWSTKSASTRIVRARRCETNISEKAGSVMEDADHGRFLQPHDLALRHRRCGRQAHRLSVQASFSAEFVRSQYRDDGFLALLGDNGDFDFAFLNVEHRIRRST